MAWPHVSESSVATHHISYFSINGPRSESWHVITTSGRYYLNLFYYLIHLLPCSMRLYHPILSLCPAHRRHQSLCHTLLPLKLFMNAVSNPKRRQDHKTYGPYIPNFIREPQWAARRSWRCIECSPNVRSFGLPKSLMIFSSLGFHHAMDHSWSIRLVSVSL